jgi:hypothetical protein
VTTWTGAARIAAGIYLVIVLAGAGFDAWSSRQERQVVVSVLGSGTRLSVLVSAGDARLLIAGGDDASAFANALAASRPFFSKRIDLLVLAGDRTDLPAASRAVNDVGARRIFVLDGPLREHLADLGLSSDRLVDRPIRIRLPRSVVVSLDPGSGPFDEPRVWSATVERGGTRLAVVSGGARPPDGVAAVILGGRYGSGALHGLDVPVLVVSAGAANGNKLRTDLAAMPSPPVWVIRVSLGQVARFRFVDGGLELPREAQPFARTPPATPAVNSPLD